MGQEVDQGMADRSHVLSWEPVRMGGESAMGKDVTDAGCMCKDGEVITFSEFLQEDDLRGTLGMLFKERPK